MRSRKVLGYRTSPPGVVRQGVLSRALGLLLGSVRFTVADGRALVVVTVPGVKRYRLWWVRKGGAYRARRWLQEARLP